MSTWLRGTDGVWNALVHARMEINVAAAAVLDVIVSNMLGNEG